ncbi:MAG: serine/threonine-protein kinase [Myxococcota bacterium]|nr:serine/threonine-protein kinase [Myxococcota bacterium]
MSINASSNVQHPLFNESPVLTVSETEIFQQYQIVTKLGTGGMGDVFLGIQRGAAGFQRLVVVKQIHAHFFNQENTLNMFIDEASLIASLDHPHIVKLIDFCKTDTSIYLVMEYVDGETLKFVRSWCKKNGISIPFPIACKMIITACEALHYAHSTTSRNGDPLHIVHRDIGLHNIMIDRNGYLKIIDFGIAKSNIQTDDTSPNLVKGNPSYMAPDLFIDTKIDSRVDIYALGLCLFELLTLQRPFMFDKSAELPQIMHTITTQDLPPPSSLVDDLPPELDQIVLRAAEKERGKRYQTADEFAKSLKEIAATYSEDFDKQDVENWFTSTFKDRMEQRRQFERRATQKAQNAGASIDRLTGIHSYPPPPTTTIMTSLLPYSSAPPGPAAGLKPFHLYLLIGALCTFFIGFIAVIYFFFFAAAPRGAPIVGDNLFVYSIPGDADLYINGAHLGTTGDQGRTLHITPQKAHSIEMYKRGYKVFTTSLTGPTTGLEKVVATLAKLEPPASSPSSNENKGDASAQGSAGGETDKSRLSKATLPLTDQEPSRARPRKRKRPRNASKAVADQVPPTAVPPENKELTADTDATKLENSQVPLLVEPTLKQIPLLYRESKPSQGETGKDLPLL